MEINQHPFAMRTLPVLIAGLMAGSMSLARAEDAALEEVIVTAQKRAENLQDVPISVDTLDAKALEKLGVVGLSDMKVMVPGLRIENYPGSSETLYPSIRSIVPNAVEVSVPIPMAIHVDGVALTQLAGINMAGADLERIEVLKGPQGVLSGRNSTGGAINFITAKPELGEFGFKQQFTFAQYGQMLSKTVVNLPVTDNFAAKISYLNSSRDNLGVSNSAPNGIKFGEKSSESYRIDMRWKATDNVLVDYGYDHAKTKSYDLPNQCLLPNRALTTAFGVNIDTLAATDPRLRSAIDGCSMSKLTTLNVPFQMPKNSNMGEGHTLNIQWDVNPDLTFRSLTGYRKVDTSNNVLYAAGAGNANVMRTDSGPLTIVGGGTPFDGQNHPWTLWNESWSQEFQLLGNMGKNLKYTTGLYYSSEKGHQAQNPGIFYTVPDMGGVGVDLIALESRVLSAKNSSWAAFGQLSWTPDILSQKLELQPGIRFTKDHRQAVASSGRGTGYLVATTADPNVVNYIMNVPLGAPYSNAVGDHTYSQLTPAISFNYHWRDDLMTYVKYSKGYTTGGFDDQAGSAASFSKGFEPETIVSYELGLKGEFLDRRLRINGDVFQSKYTNEQQTTQGAGGVWSIVNVGKATYNGAELDVTALLTDRFRASINTTWLEHSYQQWIDPVSGLDVASQRGLIVPKMSYTVSVDYHFPDVGLPGSLDGNLNVSHRDAYSQPYDKSDATMAPRVTTPGFSVWNGRLALSKIKAGPGNHGQLTVALWGKNLTNKTYYNFNTPVSSADMTTVWGEPRTYGIDLIYNY